MKTKLFRMVIAACLLLFILPVVTLAQARIMDAKLPPSGDLKIFMTSVDNIYSVKIQVGTTEGDSDIYNSTFTLAQMTVTSENVLEKNIGSLSAGAFVIITVVPVNGENKEIELVVGN